MKIYLHILPIVVSLFLLACERDVNAPVFELGIENRIVVPHYTTADFTLVLDETNKASGWEYVLAYSDSPDMSNVNMKDLKKKEGYDHVYSCSLSKLQTEKTYYYQVRVFSAYFKDKSYVNDYKSIGPAESFTTLSYKDPVVRTCEVSSVGYTSAEVSIALDDWGCDTKPTWGLCYSTSPEAVGEKVYSLKDGVDKITLSNLLDGTTYYVFAFAQSIVSTGYGETLSFQTAAFSLPKINLIEVRYISSSGAIVYGEVLSDGGKDIVEQGFCYSSYSSSPTISNLKVVYETPGVGQYPCALTGLAAGTTYYIRAYATNAMGTAYSDTFTFTTSN